MTFFTEKGIHQEGCKLPSSLGVVQGCVPVTQIPVDIASWTDFNHLKRLKESDG